MDSKEDLEKERWLGKLRVATNHKTFQIEARKALLTYPELIRPIIDAAQGNKTMKYPSGRSLLIKRLVELRKILSQYDFTEQKRNRIYTFFAEYYPKN